MEMFTPISARLVHVFPDTTLHHAHRKIHHPTKLTESQDAFSSAIDLFKKEVTQDAMDRRDSTCTLFDEALNHSVCNSKRPSMVGRLSNDYGEMKKLLPTSSSSSLNSKTHCRQSSATNSDCESLCNERISQRRHPYKLMSLCTNDGVHPPEPSPPLRRRLRDTSRELEVIYQTVFASQLAAQAPTVGWAPAAAA